MPDERFLVRELIDGIEGLLAPLMEKKRISLASGFEPPNLSLTLNRKALQIVVSPFLEDSINTA